jgi:hypothetical protein
MTIYAVGDIHGRPDDLVRVLGLIAADARRIGIARPASSSSAPRGPRAGQPRRPGCNSGQPRFDAD